MRVFIGWSGERSRLVAAALRDWMKKLIQSVEPWMPEEDLSGKRVDATSAIREARAAVLCLTGDNAQGADLHFEAGLLGSSIPTAFICPFLLGVRESEVSRPLARFPARQADREGTLSLIQAINSHPELPSPLAASHLQESFGLWWPKLEGQLRQVPAAPPQVHHTEQLLEMTEEILQTVRQIAGAQARPAALAPPPPQPSQPAPQPEAAPPAPVQRVPSLLRRLLDYGVVFPPPAPKHILLTVEQRAPGRLVFALQDKDVLALSVAYVIHGRMAEGIRALAALLDCTELGARGLFDQVRAVMAQAGIKMPPPPK